MQNKIIFISITLILMVGCMKPTQNDQNCKDGVCSLDNRPTPTSETEHNTQESNVTELTAETFNSTITSAKKPVIVDFYATWCQPCKNIKPIFAELAQEEDWVFCSIDVDKALSVAAQCNVTAMPTFVVFKNGIQWGSVKGGMQKEQLKAELEKIITAPQPSGPSEQERIQQLMTAISQRSIEDIKRLIAEGVDVNGTLAISQGNYSVMQMAIISGSEEIIDLLLAAGSVMNSDVQHAAKQYFNMIGATAENFEHHFNYVKSKITVSTPQTSTNDAALGQQFMMTMMNPSTETLKELLEKNVDVNCTFMFGKYEITPLYLALMLNNRTVMDMLIDAGASLSTLVTDEHGSKKALFDVIQAEIDNLKQGIIKSKERLQYALAKAGL